MALNIPNVGNAFDAMQQAESQSQNIFNQLIANRRINALLPGELRDQLDNHIKAQDAHILAPHTVGLTDAQAGNLRADSYKTYQLTPGQALALQDEHAKSVQAYKANEIYNKLINGEPLTPQTTPPPQSMQNQPMAAAVSTMQNAGMSGAPNSVNISAPPETPPLKSLVSASLYPSLAQKMQQPGMQQSAMQQPAVQPSAPQLTNPIANSPSPNFDGEKVVRNGNPALAALDRLAGMKIGDHEIPAPKSLGVQDGEEHLLYPSGKIVAIKTGPTEEEKQVLLMNRQESVNEAKNNAKAYFDLDQKVLNNNQVVDLANEAKDILKKDPSATGWGAGFGVKSNSSTNENTAKLKNILGKLQALTAKDTTGNRTGIASLGWVGSFKPSVWNNSTSNIAQLEEIAKEAESQNSSYNDYAKKSPSHKDLTSFKGKSTRLHYNAQTGQLEAGE